ncbi:MAG: hypothetical protein GY696_13305 [Gammaproteobacteria bacterium]|nr:hypothetical protein [Gammaproteobacteria bacterium]
MGSMEYIPDALGPGSELSRVVLTGQSGIRVAQTVRTVVRTERIPTRRSDSETVAWTERIPTRRSDSETVAWTEKRP